MTKAAYGAWLGKDVLLQIRPIGSPKYSNTVAGMRLTDICAQDDGGLHMSGKGVYAKEVFRAMFEFLAKEGGYPGWRIVANDLGEIEGVFRIMDLTTFTPDPGELGPDFRLSLESPAATPATFKLNTLTGESEMLSDVDRAYLALLEKGECYLAPEELREMRHELGIGAVDMNRAHWKLNMEAAIASAKDLPGLKKAMISIVNKVA